MTHKRLLIFLASLFSLLLLAAYANHFDNGFYFDDSHTIVTNNAIRSLKNLPSFFYDISTSSSLPANRSYRPVVTTLNALDYAIAGGLNPIYFHLSIFFWYVVQAVLLFFLFRRILALSCPDESNPLVALLSTAFYTLHTANAETINYIIMRSDSFSTLCVIAALFLYGVPKARRYYLYLVPAVIAVYTKQAGAMFAPLLFLYSLLFEETSGGEERFYAREHIVNSLRRTAPAWIVCGGLFLVNQLVLTPDTTVSTNTGVSSWSYLLSQIPVIVHYLGNFILPLNLSADPDFQVVAGPLSTAVLFGFALILSLLALALATARRRATRPVAFGILSFFIALAPTSSLIPLYQIANDHRTFFPYIGLALAVGGLAQLAVVRWRSDLEAKKWLRVGAIAAAVLAIGGHAFGIRARNEVWASSETLWHDVTIKSPGNGRGLMNYGLSQMAAGRYDVALGYFEDAGELLPRYPYIEINTGVLKNAMGRPEEAETHFRRGLQLGATNPEAHYFYGRWLNQQGRTDEAQSLLERARALSPGHTGVNELLAKLGSERRREGESEVERWGRIAESAPSAESWISLSLAHYKAEQFREAIEASRKALELRADSAVAYNNICSSHNRLGDWRQAIAACRRALEIEPGFGRAEANLRWAEEIRERRPG